VSVNRAFSTIFVRKLSIALLMGGYPVLHSNGRRPTS
jgi:hypothetical protein